MGQSPNSPPRRRKNAEVRVREYLTDAEVAKLITAAGFNRHAHRDATMVLIAYRHGLRVAELIALRWDSVDFGHGRIHVNRAKAGSPAVHPLSGRELRALRRLKREQEPESPFIFTSERGAPFTAAGFRKMIVPPWRRGQARLPGASPHAAARLRVPPGKQGRRHPYVAGLSRPQEHPAHRALHRAFADPVQGVLARLRPRTVDLCSERA